VTYHYIGKVLGVSGGWVLLGSASWVASSGRFSAALASGSLDEVEAYPGKGRVDVRLDTIVDACPWEHPVPVSTR
jgi:hypothetical protein